MRIRKMFGDRAENCEHDFFVREFTLVDANKLIE